MDKPLPQILTETGEELSRQGLGFRITAGGTSMLPALRPGDILEVVPEIPDHKKLKGCVVVVNDTKRMYAHRVHAIGSREGKIILRTRGDSLPRYDPPVDKEELLGLVVRYQRGRRIRSCRRAGPLYRLFLISWPFLYLYYRRLRHVATKIFNQGES